MSPGVFLQHILDAAEEIQNARHAEPIEDLQAALIIFDNTGGNRPNVMSQRGTDRESRAVGHRIRLTAVGPVCLCSHKPTLILGSLKE